MDLSTNGYVANSMYDNIRGLGGYGVTSDLETHSYEQTQGIKDQATLLNLYQDNKGERRSDRIDDKVCDTEKDLIRGFGAVIASQKECCCETQVALANLNGKIDLNAEKTTNQILMSQMAITSKMDADTIANMRQSELKSAYGCELASRGIFPVTTSCSK